MLLYTPTVWITLFTWPSLKILTLLHNKTVKAQGATEVLWGKVALLWSKHLLSLSKISIPGNCCLWRKNKTIQQWYNSATNRPNKVDRDNWWNSPDLSWAGAARDSQQWLREAESRARNQRNYWTVAWPLLCSHCAVIGGSYSRENYAEANGGHTHS